VQPSSTLTTHPPRAFLQLVNLTYMWLFIKLFLDLYILKKPKTSKPDAKKDK
jgi:hypothetical protein